MTQNVAESSWNLFMNTLHSGRNLLITNTYHKTTLEPFGNKSDWKWPENTKNTIFICPRVKFLCNNHLFQPPLHGKEPKSTHFTPKNHKKVIWSEFEKKYFRPFSAIFGKFGPKMLQNVPEYSWNPFKNTLHSRRNLLVTNTYHENHIGTLWKQIWLKIAKKHPKNHVFRHVFFRHGHVCGRISPKPF